MSNPDIQVREIDEAITWFSGESLKLCSCDRTCLQWVSVNPKGELYPCEYLRKSYYYGNINNIEFSDIPFSSGYREFSDIYKKNPLKCQRCDFFNVCGNGCPATRVKNGKMSLDGVYAFCDQRKRLFREASNLFEEALEGEEKK
jgi:radical SAM protein with 4Fe4S-binding SPASM domain